jgi:MinD-like ATPase involved in chromosome partitioning or flagellar assembly
MGRPSPTVVVGSDDPVLLDEVVRHLEELPSWNLAAWAATVADLRRLLEEHRPDAALLSAGLARELPPGIKETVRLVVIATEPEPGILRCALRLGAAFLLWPDERADLRGTVEAGLPLPSGAPGRLAAVWAPKGGSGASVLAAHLAAAAAATGRSTLVDLDVGHGDQRALLGAGDHGVTLLDLVAAGESPPASAIEGVTWQHPAGFGVVLAPGPPAPPFEGGRAALAPAAVAPALDALCDGAGLVVADLPSGLGRLSVEVAAAADAVALVVTPDLLALRRARDAVRLLDGHPGVGVVLNRSSRAGGLSAGDVEAVLGVEVWGRVPFQTGLLRAPDVGRLSRAACRLLRPIVGRIAAVEPSGGAELAAAGRVR